MKHKVLLEIYLPASEQLLEIRVPRQLTVAAVIKNLCQYLKRNDDIYLPTENAILCDYETGRRYSENSYIEEIGVGNGARLMLI